MNQANGRYYGYTLTFLNVSVSVFRFNRSISRIISFINYCVFKLMMNKNIQHEKKNSKSKIVLSAVRAWKLITKVGILLYCKRLQTCNTHVHVKHYCIPFVWRRSARQFYSGSPCDSYNHRLKINTQNL